MITEHTIHLEEKKPEEARRADTRTIFGFFVYIMSDCIVFASLFAAYAVLRNNTYGGESAGELFSQPFILAETIILLFSSFAYGLAAVYVRRENKKKAVSWMLAAFVLGAVFLAMEITEFAKLFEEGNGWQRSGFLSAFFALVGTHGLHIFIGLVWIGSVIVGILRRGCSGDMIRKSFLLGLFWHFLDIVWIFIFTFVYLMSAI